MVKQPVSVNGVVRWKDVGLADQAKSEQKERKMVVLRHEIGDVLRDVRQRQGRMLREVSDRVAVAEGVAVPDTVPQEFSQRYGRDLDRDLNNELNDELSTGLL